MQSSGRKKKVTLIQLRACLFTLHTQVSGTVACNRVGGKISRQVNRGIIRKGVGYGWNNFFGCTQVRGLCVCFRITVVNGVLWGVCACVSEKHNRGLKE